MSKKRPLRIAAYNINGINSRLHVLTRWLEEFAPDIACLQELKCTDEAFPAEAIEALGYSAIWHGQRSWNGVAILSRVGAPVETRRALPNDPNLEQSRYLEAAVCGIIVGNMYAPNGNPWPGPKFDYKLAWLDALKAHAQALLDSKAPVILLGDYNGVTGDLNRFFAGDPTAGAFMSGFFPGWSVSGRCPDASTITPSPSEPRSETISKPSAAPCTSATIWPGRSSPTSTVTTALPA